MIAVQILEPGDRIEPTDWCRPLQLQTMSGGMGDGMSFKSCYSGLPENHVQWAMVRHVLGATWIGDTVKAVNRALQLPHEFIRGEPPKSHQLDMSDYNRLMP